MTVGSTRLARRFLVSALALSSVALGATVPAAAPAGAAAAAGARTVTTTNGCVASVPEPGTSTPVKICWTVFKPVGASARNRVPMVMEGHGWGGSRLTDPSQAADLLRAGFGVISFDQRGWGESGGYAHLEDPRFEGKDVRRLVSMVARLPWVIKDRPGDPRIGAYGGSYGGGYQFAGAFSELRDKGRTRFDALAPEITWNRLDNSLFPQGVARTEWIAALYALSLPSNVLPPALTAGLAQALATGNVPESVQRFVGRSGPGQFAGRGRRLDIPVLFGQGETDSLFPLNEGLINYDTTLTKRARKQSIFVAYNAGHVLPTLLPPGTNPFDPTTLPYSAAADPCSRKLSGGDFGRLRLRFLKKHLMDKGKALPGTGRYHLATAGGRCVSVAAVRPNTTRRVQDVLTTVGVGVPMSVPVARGGLTVVGSPTLDATVTGTSPDNRVLVALSVGRTPLDAKIVQNNMLPLRQLGIGATRKRSNVKLPSLAVDVPRGQNLYLTVSPISDMTLGFGSRVVGALTLRDVVVHLPVVRR